jgi:hypothetical protein
MDATVKVRTERGPPLVDDMMPGLLVGGCSAFIVYVYMTPWPRDKLGINVITI